MAVAIGTRLGPYEILGLLGAGGMGEVYKARDTRLDRTVAIKVLAPHVLAEPGLRARFEREARTASSLDHPNICVLHDVGREGDVEYIVMQHLDGETLAARLARGPLALGEALRYATEIASALDRAHRAGILHRDIKPGNVMLVKSAGRDLSAKLLDFGLAKTLVPRAAAAGEAVPATASSPLTGQGTIVGTLLYMSPEQLEGRDVDARSDIFSFGAVLYEMVTGRRAFDGGNQASIIAAILERDPPSMAAAVPVTPPALDRVVRKCLAKDRDRRWQSAADLCDELSWIAQSSGGQPVPSGVVVQATKSRAPIVVAVLALLVIALSALLAWKLLRKDDGPAATARHLAISMPDGLRLVRGGIAASHDGQSIVFVASADAAAGSATESSSASSRLFLRRLNAVEATPISGTEGARAPFFSPDSQSVGYFTENALMKVSLRGGQPVRVGGVPPVSRGGVWLPDESIVVSPTQTSGLVRFSPDGTPRPITTPDAAQGEIAHTWPQMLPGGADILYTIRRGTSEDLSASDIGLLHLASGERRILLKGAAFAQYASTGHLVFLRGGTLSAVPFDLRTKQIGGSPYPLADAVAVDPWIGGAHFAVAPDGTILVVRGTFPEIRRSAVWVDRDGKAVPAPGIGERLPQDPRIAPGGAQAMYSARTAEGDNEIYLADLARGTSVRLSGDPRDDFNAVWTPDGRRAVWTALPAARMPFLVMRASDGTGPTEEIYPDPDAAQFVGSVSAEGILAFTRIQVGLTDIWTVPLNGDRKARPFIATEAWEIGPEFSPDGRWIAYVSNEAGARDVYVVPYPGPGPKRRVSSQGGISPAWSRDGRELFYLTREGLVAVSVGQGPGLDFSPPRLLFETARFFAEATEDGPRHYDVAPDGRRFLMLLTEPAPATAPPGLHVLLNWVAGLR